MTGTHTGNYRLTVVIVAYPIYTSNHKVNFNATSITHIKMHFLPATFHMHVNSYCEACNAELTSSIKKQTKNGQTQFVGYTRSHILTHHST